MTSRKFLAFFHATYQYCLSRFGNPPPPLSSVTSFMDGPLPHPDVGPATLNVDASPRPPIEHSWGSSPRWKQRQNQKNHSAGMFVSQFSPIVDMSHNVGRVDRGSLPALRQQPLSLLSSTFSGSVILERLVPLDGRSGWLFKHSAVS